MQEDRRCGGGGGKRAEVDREEERGRRTGRMWKDEEGT
jgi:hypothetical protein